MPHACKSHMVTFTVPQLHQLLISNALRVASLVGCWARAGVMLYKWRLHAVGIVPHLITMGLLKS